MIFFGVLISKSYSQLKASTIAENRNRLYFEITDHSVIESECIALSSFYKSQVWKKADTLLSNLSLNVLLKYFDTSSHIVKYYAYLRILKSNDVVAFQKLKQIISDSSKVTFQFDDYGGEEKFNQLLVREYKYIIQAKFGNNSKLWKIKYGQLEQLSSLHGLKSL